MKYNPAIHHRRSIRLRDYDYRQEGAYFITICVQYMRCIFGHIEHKEMIMNEFGQIAYWKWEQLPERWPHIELGAFQVILGKVWQRNYWDDIIRDIGAFNRITTYIINNPANWDEDRFYNAS